MRSTAPNSSRRACERLDLKRAVLAETDAAAPADTVIASSTSGLLPSDMQRDLAQPGRMLVGHPFNPVYLLPLVEVVGGRATDPAAVERARRVYESIGMKPVVVRKEIDAFIGDRLQERCGARRYGSCTTASQRSRRSTT